MTQESGLLPPKQEQAALLVAEDRHADAEIARSVGVSRASITRWKRLDVFQERVTALQQMLSEAVDAAGIADRQARVDALNDRWARMKQVIAQRATEMDGECAGGDTGLLVRQVKLSPDGTAVHEYAVDTGLLKEMRAHEQQAAQELGQWTEKRDVMSGGRSLHEALTELRAVAVTFAVPDVDNPFDGD